ncbi:hypothetical protein ABW19_dt0203590 [Dactylella cylindrospora]|nr:hypothetical protein ABW19_dt0203590 [Dactylella cylindrospora]
MKYEKLPTEDYDDDAQELSVELATNVDSDEEVDQTLPITESSSASADDNISTPASPRDRRRRRSIWIRHLHVFVLLLFTTIVVFTFLPTLLNKFIVWRHNKFFGGSCKDKSGKKGVGKNMDSVNLHTVSTTSYSPNPYIQLSALPSKYIPTPAPSDSGKTLIIIGDVHGALIEFQELLTKLEGKGFLENSHIVLAGDMISKGPDSLGLLDTAMALNASCVRGNHEDELMRVYWRLQKKKNKKAGKSEESDDDDEDDDDDDDDDKEDKDVKEAKEEIDGIKEQKDIEKRTPSPKKDKKNKKDKKHKKGKKKTSHHDKKYKHSDVLLAKSLKPHHVAYIESCPLILKIDSASTIGDVAVVHAGMIPGIDLAKQKPSVLMNIRTFVKKVPTPGRKGIHWSRLWNEYQEGLLKSGLGKALTVVYGHDARRGLEIKKWTKGLDTNCVRGGRLTAFVIKGGSKGGTRVVSVKCKKYAH